MPEEHVFQIIRLRAAFAGGVVEMDTPKIRDLIYFDFEKASSLWSQLQWGRLESLAVTTEGGSTKGFNVETGIPNVAKAGLNLGEGERRTILETRILHHDLLNRIESFLSANQLVVNLNEVISPEETSADEIRAKLGKMPYVVATGWSEIEDFKRLSLFSDKFNSISEFISKSVQEGLKKNPEYLELLAQRDAAKKRANSMPDRNEKAKARAQLGELDRKTEQLMAQVNPMKVEQWLLDGIKLWISVFAPTRINFHVYPFPKCPAFQILCNLKRDSFVDQDLEHLIFSYGIRPNVPLSIFGLVTSVPGETGAIFDPLSEFSGQENMSNYMAFEKAFRAMFPAYDAMEAFFRYSRYPNITVQPIAVFRELRADKAGPASAESSG